MSDIRIGDRVECKFGFTHNKAFSDYAGRGYIAKTQFIVKEIKGPITFSHFQNGKAKGVHVKALKLIHRPKLDDYECY